MRSYKLSWEFSLIKWRLKSLDTKKPDWVANQVYTGGQPNFARTHSGNYINCQK